MLPRHPQSTLSAWVQARRKVLKSGHVFCSIHDERGQPAAYRLQLREQAQDSTDLITKITEKEENWLSLTVALWKISRS